MLVASKSPPAPPAIGLLDTWIDAWGAAATGVAHCLIGSLTNQPSILDVPRWFELVTVRGRPSWTTPNEIVFEEPVARLRDFSTSSAPGLIPTLVLPPQAGHDSCIVDFSSEQSQMGAILAAGLERALSLDWIGATAETADASIDDYLEVIDRAVVHCGGRVNLIGDCQGGWLATIYAALNPERVNTLTLAGAPIDFHCGEPVIHEVLGSFAPLGDVRFYEALIAADGGVLKGEHMIAGFILIGPGAEISRQLELLANLGDPAHVARYTEFEDWFKHTQDIPGQFYLWIIRHLFRDNALINGTLKIGTQRVDLGRIDMPLNLLGGATDHITPADQVYAIADYASTPPKHVHRYLSTGGHLGLFMGHEALRKRWPLLLRNVLSHSR